MICITYLLFSAFVSAPLGQQINQYLKSSDISDSFKFWPKFNKTGLHYSKSIKKVGIQVQNGFPLNQFNKIFSSISDITGNLNFYNFNLVDIFFAMAKVC